MNNKRMYTWTPRYARTKMIIRNAAISHAAICLFRLHASIKDFIKKHWPFAGSPAFPGLQFCLAKAPTPSSLDILQARWSHCLMLLMSLDFAPLEKFRPPVRTFKVRYKSLCRVRPCFNQRLLHMSPNLMHTSICNLTSLPGRFSLVRHDVITIKLASSESWALGVLTPIALDNIYATDSIYLLVANDVGLISDDCIRTFNMAKELSFIPCIPSAKIGLPLWPAPAHAVTLSSKELTLVKDWVKGPKANNVHWPTLHSNICLCTTLHEIPSRVSFPPRKDLKLHDLWHRHYRIFAYPFIRFPLYLFPLIRSSDSRLSRIFAYPVIRSSGCPQLPEIHIRLPLSAGAIAGVSVSVLTSISRGLHGTNDRWSPLHVTTWQCFFEDVAWLQRSWSGSQ